MSRVTVFDKNGHFLTDVRAVTRRSWIGNAIPTPGECSFDVSRFDAKASEKYLRIGNYVLVRNSRLPDWIGVIMVNTWSDGYVTIRAMQAEYILHKRNTPIVRIEGTAGALFAQVLAHANGQPFNDKMVFPYSIDTGGAVRQQDLGTDALTLLQNIAMRNSNDFSITYAFDSNGRLYLNGIWYKRRGVIVSGPNNYLRESYNVMLTDGVLEQDARESANYVEGRGDAATNGTRKISAAYDETSISLYGLLQRATVFSGNTQQATIQASAISQLRAIKNPLTSYDITAINIGSTFNSLDIGNVMQLELNTAGWEGETFGTNKAVKIMGMEHDDETDTCRLIVEEYEDNE